MKKFFIITSIILVAFFGAKASEIDHHIGFLPDSTQYISNRVIVTNFSDAPQFRTGFAIDGYAVTGVESVDRLCRELEVTSVKKFYPGKLRNEILKQTASRIYIFTLEDGIDARVAASVLSTGECIQTAEIQTIPRLLYTPNDPFISMQWYLEQVQVYAAWDYVRGDTTRHSIIAIVDAGINYNHEDLEANIWINELEEINGQDDDNNGFIDDVRGWNFVDNNNDPMTSIGHGTGVAACASEVTDNSIMGAGIGFSARLMNLKAISDYGYLVDGYPAMLYAADNGAQVINCSWGVTTYSQYEQDIVNAVWDSDVLIVAAGGEQNQLTYPAAYDNVMAVSALDQYDYKAPFAPYGEYIDICAPGNEISIPWGDDFNTVSGTSFAAGMVSGLAGLVRTWYPALSNEETWQLIIESADPVDSLNPGYQGQLGAGRINAANCMMTGIDYEPSLPQQNSLLECYPNPFNAAVTIEYKLDTAGESQIAIYDILGRKVETLYQGQRQAGSYKITWNAGNLPSGIYFARLALNGQDATVRLVLLK